MDSLTLFLFAAWTRPASLCLCACMWHLSASLPILIIQIQRLLGACKANGTSVTGALTAACCQTMEKFIDRKYKYRLKAEILVNFRGKCTAEGSQDAHQLYAAPMDVMLHGGGTPETALNFWETAKKVRMRGCVYHLWASHVFCSDTILTVHPFLLTPLLYCRSSKILKTSSLSLTWSSIHWTSFIH